QVDVGFSQKPIIDGKAGVVVATVADRRRVSGGMIGAAVKPGACVVDDAVGAVDESHVLWIVAHLFLGDPAVDVGLAEPKMVGGKCASHRVIAPAHDALARRSIVGEG